MKAKEYAKLLKEVPTPETMAKVADMYLQECKILIVTRGAKTDSAGLAIMREQDDKWRAMCRIFPLMKEDGFRTLVKTYFPVVYNALKW